MYILLHMHSIPRLALTHGQVAWALCAGQPPDKVTLDRLRYLRQLNVPFAQDEAGGGRGNRLTYRFDHLIECAIAVWSLRRGTKPRAAAEFLIAERTGLRKFFREHFKAMPDAALTAEWVKSRGRIVPTMVDEIYLRLHARSGETGTLKAMTLDEVLMFKAAIGDQVEQYGNEIQALVPLRRVMLEAVAWALIAPVTPPGRVPRRKEFEVTL